MADTIHLEVNADQLAARIRSLPGLTRDEVVRGMRQVVGKVEARVLRNIAERFGDKHSAGRPAHIPLKDSVLGKVVAQGDLVIGEVTLDEGDEIPYAKILEAGGVTSAHIIRPKTAGALAFEMSTLHAPARSRRPGAGEDPEDITVQYVKHPGARIAAYHFMLDALQAIEKEVSGDLEGVWRRVIMKAAF